MLVLFSNIYIANTYYIGNIFLYSKEHFYFYFTIFFVLVTRVIGALQVFDLIFMVMDKSNPALIKTQSLVYLFYEYSFRQKNQGYGSAIVVLLLVVIMIVTVFQMIGQKKWVYYN